MGQGGVGPAQAFGLLCMQCVGRAHVGCGWDAATRCCCAPCTVSLSALGKPLVLLLLQAWGPLVSSSSFCRPPAPTCRLLSYDQRNDGHQDRFRGEGGCELAAQGCAAAWDAHVRALGVMMCALCPGSRCPAQPPSPARPPTCCVPPTPRPLAAAERLCGGLQRARHRVPGDHRHRGVRPDERHHHQRRVLPGPGGCLLPGGGERPWMVGSVGRAMDAVELTGDIMCPDRCG